MKKLMLATLALFPFVAGCYAYVPAYRARYYGPYGYARVYGPRPVVVAPVIVPPPRVRVYY